MYDYSKERPKLFTDEGQRAFLAVRDHTRALLLRSGAVTMGKAMSAPRGPNDSWQMLACVDRLVELGELREVGDGRLVAAQDRVFVEGTP